MPNILLYLVEVQSHQHIKLTFAINLWWTTVTPMLCSEIFWHFISGRVWTPISGHYSFTPGTEKYWCGRIGVWQTWSLHPMTCMQISNINISYLYPVRSPGGRAVHSGGDTCVRLLRPPFFSITLTQRPHIFLQSHPKTHIFSQNCVLSPKAPIFTENLKFWRQMTPNFWNFS